MQTTGFDFLGNKVEVGSEVIFANKGYRSFNIGTITKMTEYYVFIKPSKSMLGFSASQKEFRQLYSQIILKP